MLAGGGPADVVELTLALAREMLAAAGLTDADPAKALADGSAMDAWRRMIAAQGGDPDAPLPTAREQHVVTAAVLRACSTRLDAYAVGVAAWRLGAGRARKEDPVQAGAGVELHAKPGDRVTEGQPLLTLHTDTPERFEYALEALEDACDIAAQGTEFNRDAGGPGTHRLTGLFPFRMTGPDERDRWTPAGPVRTSGPIPGRRRRAGTDESREGGASTDRGFRDTRCAGASPVRRPGRRGAAEP